MSKNEQISIYTRRFNKETMWGRELIYVMTREAFNGWMKIFKHPVELMDYLTRANGLLGNVTEIHIEG